MSEILREMVLFPSDSQFEEKSDELQLGACWWSISTLPKDYDDLIGTKIYFYDKRRNAIVRRSTITDFGYEMGKKVVYFEDEITLDENSNEVNEDEDFFLDLDELGIPPRTQTRGYCYRWW